MDQVSDLLLTHLDGDHFNPAWSRTLAKGKIKVHVHEKHLSRAVAHGLDHEILCPFDTSVDIGEVHIETVHMTHDTLGTTGFIFNLPGIRFGFATDLGSVPRTLLQSFTSLDALAIESNYDPTMQRSSGRPISLQDRIMGGSGHLSNEESLAAVEQIAESSQLQHIVLLHLSQQCNSPSIIRSLYQDNLANLYDTLTITSQDRCSRLLTLEKQGVVTPKQLF